MRLIDADKAVEQIDDIFSVDDGRGMIPVGMTKALVRSMLTLESITPTVDGWVSVKDSTPTVMHLDCWVMIKDCPIPMIDYWEGDRGEESTGVFPDGEKTFVKSGWYYNDCNEVTHWMPIWTPEPPEEVSGDG